MAYIVPKEIPKSCNKCPFGFCVEYHPFWSNDDEKRNTKIIRCQSVKPFRETTLDIKDETFRAEWCPLVEIPTADVAEVKHGGWHILPEDPYDESGSPTEAGWYRVITADGEETTDYFFNKPTLVASGGASYWKNNKKLIRAWAKMDERV